MKSLVRESNTLCGLALLLLFAGWGIATPCCAQPVNLIVKEKFGIERQHYPVSSEVPFAKGALKDVKSLALSNPRGALVPFQPHVMARWGDESVQWLRVDFLADIAAEGTGVYKLIESKGPAASLPAAEALHLAETPDKYTVTGDDLQLDVMKNLRYMLGSLRLGQEEVLRPGATTLKVRKGPAEAEAEATECIPTLDASGEIRAAVSCTGELKYLLKPTGWVKFPAREESFRARLRVERFGGTRWVRVTYSFSRSLQDVWVRVGQRFDLGEGPIRYDLCAFNKFSGTLNPTDSVTLARDEALRPWPIPMWAISSGPDYDPTKLLLRGYVPAGRLDRKMEMAGWADISGKKCEMILAFQDFWRGDFKRLTISGDGRVEIGVYLRPMINLPVVSSEQDRWATVTVTYAFSPTPIPDPETTARSIIGGVSARCPTDYYLNCGMKPPPGVE